MLFPEMGQSPWSSSRVATGTPANTSGELHPIKGSVDAKILSESDFDHRHNSKSKTYGDFFQCGVMSYLVSEFSSQLAVD